MEAVTNFCHLLLVLTKLQRRFHCYTSRMSEASIDKELVNQVLKGDKEAFDVLVLKYQASISRVVGKIIDSDPTAVGDVVQETFINAYRALGGFEGKSSFYTWLYRIAINTTKNYIKYRSRRPPDTDIDIKEVISNGKYLINDAASPDKLLHRDEVQEAVLNAVNKLPDELRTSIVLREMGGLSYDEIANVMQCPVGTVRSRIFRARLAVDEHIKPLLNYE